MQQFVFFTSLKRQTMKLKPGSDNRVKEIFYSSINSVLQVFWVERGAWSSRDYCR